MTYILMSIILYLADQVTKRQADKRIPLGTRVELVKGKLFLTNVRNTGAAMGLFSKNRKLLMGMSFLSLTVWGEIIFRMIRRGEESRLLKSAVAIMTAGAAGNLMDRIRKRYVTDFISIDHKNAPVFNLADLFILIGTVLCMAKSLLEKE